MRSRERRLVVSATVSVALAVSTALASTASADDPAQDKAAVDEQLTTAKGDVEESTEAVAAATAALQEVDAQLAQAQSALTDAKTQLDTARVEDERLAAELAAAQTAERAAESALADIEDSIDADRAVLSGLARSAYQGGQLSQLSALLESGSFDAYTARSEAMRSLLRSQNATVDALTDDRAQLANRQAGLEGIREQVSTLRTAAAANVVAKAQLEQAAVDAEAAVEQLRQQRARVLADAQASLAADEAEYTALQAERSRLEKVLADRAAAAAAASASRSEPAAPAPPASDSGGILYRPVGGWITSPYGWRIHPITGQRKFHDGTDFGSACGTPIRAAASGTVLSAYYAGGYGNQTVIEHGIVNGVSLATSYNHQSQFGVSAGDHVDRGEVIGYVGTTGFSTGCHLHFMVYVNGATTDPMGWL